MAYAVDNRHLFSQGELREVLLSVERQMAATVDEIPSDQFLNTSHQTLTDHLISRFTEEPIQIYEDQMTIESEESEVDVSNDPDRNWFQDEHDRGPIMVKSLKLTIHLPYTGNHFFWDMKPSRWRNSFPKGIVRGKGSDGLGELLIVINRPSDEGREKIQRIKVQVLDDIRFFLNEQQTQIEAFNRNLPDFVNRAIGARREELKAHDDVLASLDIPLRPKDGAPAFTPIPVEKVVVPLPPPPKSGCKKEPGINPDIYEFILKVIRSEGRAWETTPKTYAGHDEEELRDIILSHLNTHFEGGATGETFRKKGKTDIHITEKDKAAFVAECKIWGGEKLLLEALDQLLGYLTWRDCKAALVIFNKKVAGFSGILEKIPAALESHLNYVRTVSAEPNDGEWRFVFRSAEDEAREINVHVFAFNLFVKA